MTARMFDTDAMVMTANRAAEDNAPSPNGLAQLQELFPSYDAEIIESVLLSCQGDVEHAIASILSMGGPGGTPDSKATPDGEADPKVDTDEEVALAVMRPLSHLPACPLLAFC